MIWLLPHPLPTSPVINMSLFLTLRVCRFLTGGGGGGLVGWGGTKLYEREEAWSSINHLILSGMEQWSGETSSGGLPNRWSAPRVREGGVGSVKALQHVVEVDLVPVTEHEDGHVTTLRDLAKQLLLQHAVYCQIKEESSHGSRKKFRENFPWMDRVTRYTYIF